MTTGGLRMVNNQRGSALVQTIWALAGLLVIAAATLHIVWQLRASTTNFTTPFQAVLLTNGSVYFGHLQGYGGHNPVLTDVYYIVTQTNPETKQSNNVLVKRGKELHEPDVREDPAARRRRPSPDGRTDPLGGAARRALGVPAGRRRERRRVAAVRHAGLRSATISTTTAAHRSRDYRGQRGPR